MFNLSDGVRLFNRSMTGVTSGAGTAHTSVLSGVRVPQSLVLCIVFCRSLFVLLLLTIVVFVLRLTASEIPPSVSSHFSYHSASTFYNNV